MVGKPPEDFPGATRGQAEYTTGSAVCSVTVEPVMRTIAHAKASGDWDGPGGGREAHKNFAARRQLGAMVEMLYIVTVWKQNARRQISPPGGLCVSTPPTSTTAPPWPTRC